VKTDINGGISYIVTLLWLFVM